MFCALMKFGGLGDAEAINYAMCSGVKGIFTAHGSSLRDVKLNKEINVLFKNYIFDRVVFLNSRGKRGTLEKVYFLDKEKLEYLLMKELEEKRDANDKNIYI